MYKTGEIIYFDHLIFKDNQVDSKKNRPCIVLHSELDEENKCKIFYCPLTTSSRSFNRRPWYYQLIAHPVFNKKLSFAKLNSLQSCYDEGQIHRTGIVLEKDGLSIIKRLAQEYKRQTKGFDSTETKELLQHFNTHLSSHHKKSIKVYQK